LLCAHNSLQTCSNQKTLRARRRLLDKQAWKTLKTLFPDSTQLTSEKGECVQCLAEAKIAFKTTHEDQEQLKLLRKQPLTDPLVRRFYTRSKGVPEQALRDTTARCCPLKPGRYYILPRAWCSGWRRYIKTGEGASVTKGYPSPDATSLLCHAHKIVLVPPHLEAFLYGESDQLLGAALPPPLEVAPAAAAAAAAPVGALDPESLQALQAAGLGPGEVRRQLVAMRNVEQQQQQLQEPPPSPPLTKNERLDLENHSVVEIITHDEFSALETLWPNVFGVHFDVVPVHWSMPVCRDCDATGYAHWPKCVVRGRVKNSKTGDTYKAVRAPVEY
jgi:hypothetical protein